jgi:hypothetical protein
MFRAELFLYDHCVLNEIVLACSSHSERHYGCMLMSLRAKIYLHKHDVLAEFLSAYIRWFDWLTLSCVRCSLRNCALARLSPHFHDVSIKVMTLCVRYFLRGYSFVCITYRHELFRRRNDVLSKTLSSCTSSFERNYIAISMTFLRVEDVSSDNTVYPRKHYVSNETLSSCTRCFEAECTLLCIGFLARLYTVVRIMFPARLLPHAQNIPSEIISSYARCC